MGQLQEREGPDYQGGTPLHNTRRELFVSNKLRGLSNVDAVKAAGYKCDGVSARVQAGRLLTNVYVSRRLRFLEQQAQVKTICAVEERKRILSEIARGKLTDYFDEDGGVAFEAGCVNPHAVDEYTEELYGETKNSPGMTRKKLKLRDPIRAISELNKLEGAYAPEPVPAGTKTLLDILAEVDKHHEELPETRIPKKWSDRMAAMQREAAKGREEARKARKGKDNE